MVIGGSSSTDVFVAGGGPAGLAAAIAARMRGLSVVVADCAKPPIDKACGEGLMPDGVSALLELGVVLGETEVARFRGIRFLGCGDSVEARFPEGEGVGVRRTVLHQAMTDRAEELGVELLWGTRVSAIRDSAVLAGGRRIGCRWIIGADGQKSMVRQWAGIDANRTVATRLGFRQHFSIAPWSDFVEVHWGAESQAYVTPIAKSEICVAIVARKRPASFDAALAEFPLLASRIAHAHQSTNVRGAVTVTRRFRKITRENVALIGEASGSVDAVTGEGLAMSFRQAVALADAMVNADLASYVSAHRRLARMPAALGRTLLLMDQHGRLRARALRALARQPRMFADLLSVHIGENSLTNISVPGLLRFGWQFLTATGASNSY